MRRFWLGSVVLLGILVFAEGAEKKGGRKAAPVPLREEPLDKTEAAAIADLPLGVCLWSEELLNLAAPYLRKGDHVMVGTSQAALMDRIPKGVYKVLFLPRKHELAETEAYRQAIQKADALAMDDTPPGLDQVQWIRQMADKHGKQALLLPTGEDVQRQGAEMAPYADIFLIQAQRWLVEDRSRGLQPFSEKVHAVAETLRKANPKVQIWVQVGRKLEYGGGNAGVYVHALWRLRAAHPEDLAHGQVFISKLPDTQPGHGKQALIEFLEAVRIKAVDTALPRDLTPPLPETSVILNLYDLSRTEVVQPAVDALAPLVRPHDVFVLVSGNHQGAPDIAAVARWAESLNQRFPHNPIWVLSSGLANVQALAAARGKIPACVTTIVYDYEPNWDNEPEFDADFAKTVANFTQAVKLAHGAGFALVGAPTGRPLLKGEFARYGWDYGRLAQASGADGMEVQTQTYCKQGLDDFKAAMAKLKAQQVGAGVPLDRLYPQVTVDPNAINGAPTPQAVACVRAARDAGFSRITLWFSPARVQSAVDFLRALGRQSPPGDGSSGK